MNAEVNPYEEYRVGVDNPGFYAEVFNTDDRDFGGSGVVNEKVFTAEEIPFHGRKYSVVLRLPPLGGIIFKRLYARKRTI